MDFRDLQLRRAEIWHKMQILYADGKCLSRLYFDCTKGSARHQRVQEVMEHANVQKWVSWCTRPHYPGRFSPRQHHNPTIPKATNVFCHPPGTVSLMRPQRSNRLITPGSIFIGGILRGLHSLTLTHALFNLEVATAEIESSNTRRARSLFHGAIIPSLQSLTLPTHLRCYVEVATAEANDV